MSTIKDVAKLAGVGVGTASRAISGKGAVSPETLVRVRQAVAELGFRPSNVARALSLKSTGMLGVYVPIFEGTFYGPMLQAIDAELRAVNRHMVAANGCGTADARQQALDGVDFLIQRQCDGILVLSNDLLDEDFVALHARFERLAVLNRSVPAGGPAAFSTDHRQGGVLAAQALLSKGHREIALIGGPDSAPDNRARLAGFHAELARHGVQVAPEHQAEGDFAFAGGHAAALALLARRKKGRGKATSALPYTAIFCANDVMAMAAISAFTHAGIRVPQDLSVIGFDDSDVAAYTAPQLTSVRIPVDEVAVSGCRHMLQLCYGLALPYAREFPPRLVWRESVVNGPHTPIVFPDHDSPKAG
jgi:LacI family transcriptional regulator